MLVICSVLEEPVQCAGASEGRRYAQGPVLAGRGAVPAV